MNLDATFEWYRKVLGMIINHRSAPPAGARSVSPFSNGRTVPGERLEHWQFTPIGDIPSYLLHRGRERTSLITHAATNTSIRPGADGRVSKKLSGR